MRKQAKEAILELIRTIGQAHGEVTRQLEQGQLNVARDMLAQCQEAALGIANTIEKSEGENCPAIALLLKYCECLFQIYGNLEAYVGTAGREMEERLNACLTQIEDSVKKEIPVRREIVFCPYKASMWDSLESVYLEAKKDPQKDVYCIPIPYYDRKPDGSLGQMHYEGAEYPKNIEITDWLAYDFESRRPDEIYIHNPYDDCNLVTCVHPRFFSRNLKQYTDKLVYIPYFVLDEINPENQAEIDGIKHFIWTPGVIFADKVILQSENMKQIYINEYLKEAQEKGLTGKHLDRAYLEQKFDGSGSPKFDKVKRTEKENLEIPEEWKKIICKEDGSYKKIVFYNNTISTLLREGEQVIRKMKDVFRIFYENRDEVALLWRPHPLIETTLTSMRPQLWVAYREIRDQYLQEGWGIYDDSSDLDRAIVLSDAYYGDMSSVVQVYRKTGKPIMVENVAILGR